MFARIQKLFGLSQVRVENRKASRREKSRRRSDDASGRFGVERLETRKMMAADFDGDGFDDLAIGASGEDAGALNAGAIVISYGAGAGLGARNVHWDQAALGGVNNAGDWFGTALSYGDYNNDGFDDLAVSSPGETVAGNVNAGLVYVVYGSALGLNPATAVAITQNSPFVPDVAGVGDTFGKALATGDFNNDGYDDLAVGVPGETVTGNVGAGAVNVIYGGALGIGWANQFWTQDSGGVLDLAEPADGFGSTLSTGDYNGDGNDDLAVGVWNEDVGALVDAGMVNVLYGSGALLTAVGNQAFTQDNPGVPDVCEAGDQFGWALASGDFNNDGRDDLAAGVPMEDQGALVNSGVVNVIYGGGLGLGAFNQLWSQDVAGVAEVSEADDRFGWSLTAGDFNNDGNDDLAIGVMGEDMTVANDGSVQVLYGVAMTGLGIAGNTIWFQDAIGIADFGEVDDFFGSALADGDFNGDGYDDLAIGVIGEDLGINVDAGAVEVLYGQLGFGVGAAGSQFFDEFALTGFIATGNGFGGTLGRRR